MINNVDDNCQNTSLQHEDNYEYKEYDGGSSNKEENGFVMHNFLPHNDVDNFFSKYEGGFSERRVK